MITRELLDKFRRGECTREELSYLKSCFSDKDPEGVNKLLDEDWNNPEIVAEDHSFTESKMRIWDRLEGQGAGAQSDLPEEAEVKTGWWQVKWSRLAAAVVAFCMLAAGGFLLWQPQAGVVSDGRTLKEFRNEQNMVQDILLSDGSLVSLEPNSVLRYPDLFTEGERIVSLDGKAFFKVAKDSLNPFFVKTSSLDVKVLGTSFSVSSFENRPAEVAVVTGKVAVFGKAKQNALILEPNEKVVQEKEVFAKMLVEEPVIVRKEALNGLFDFDETPAATVFRALENAYDIRIKFDADQLKDCSLKARLDDQSLFVKMDMICASLGLEYEVVGTDIRISGVGCHRD